MLYNSFNFRKISLISTMETAEHQETSENGDEDFPILVTLVDYGLGETLKRGIYICKCECGRERPKCPNHKCGMKVLQLLRVLTTNARTIFLLVFNFMEKPPPIINMLWFATSATMRILIGILEMLREFSLRDYAEVHFPKSRRPNFRELLQSLANQTATRRAKICFRLYWIVFVLLTIQSDCFGL